VLGRSNNHALQSMAGSGFEQALPAILETTSPRAWGVPLICIHEYLRRFSGDRMVNQIRNDLAERLLDIYQKTRRDKWLWYEERLTYCNAVLHQAMLMCGQWIPNSNMTKAGLESLKWLADLQRPDTTGNYFVPI